MALTTDEHATLTVAEAMQRLAALNARAATKELRPARGCSKVTQVLEVIE